MGQQSVWHRLAIAAHGVERAAEINGVPQRYRGCDQGEPAGAVRASEVARLLNDRGEHQINADRERAVNRHGQLLRTP